jgi:hypothetical protein
MRVVTIAAAALLVGATASAQDEPARRAATEVAARVPLEMPTKGAPYSAETYVEGTQTLADGNRINRKTTGRVFRDGEGRTRREEDRPNGVVSISITDPVGGYSYSLDTRNKVAWRTPMGTSRVIMDKVEATWVEAARGDAEKRAAEVTAAGSGRGVATTTNPAGASAGGGGGGGVQTVTGSYTRMAMPAIAPTPAAPLERKILEGLQVEGRKTTTTIPAGQIGNEQPLTIVSEQWRSPELNLLVMTRHADPRTGESTYRLANIIRAEPDRSLFMVPPDYEVKDTGIRRMLETPRR